jgi:hypothetical protein
MVEKGISVWGAQTKKEGLADETAAFYAEQGGARQVRLKNHPVPVKAEIPDRGEVVQVDIFFVRFRDLRLCPLKLFVLHFELDLVHLQLVDKSFHIRRVHPCQAFFRQTFLCLSAQTGRSTGLRPPASSGFVLFSPHTDSSLWLPYA